MFYVFIRRWDDKPEHTQEDHMKRNGDDHLQAKERILIKNQSGKHLDLRFLYYRILRK
jgi:hypothetical protein